MVCIAQTGIESQHRFERFVHLHSLVSLLPPLPNQLAGECQNRRQRHPQTAAEAGLAPPRVTQGWVAVALLVLRLEA